MLIPAIRPLFLAALLTGLCSTTRAQEAFVHWHVMGGYSDTVGPTADFLQGGYLLGGGFSVAPTPRSPLELRFDLTYSDHNATDHFINVGQQATNGAVDSGTGSFWSASGNLVYRIPINYAVRAYGIAGVGAYHERLELTQSFLVDGGVFCDPFTGFCDGGFLVGQTVVAAHDVTKFGWNAGAGLEFPLTYRNNGPAWFIEARYHRISTPMPTEYVPIVIGMRY
jgi:opacity protein-like surface antigen